MEQTIKVGNGAEAFIELLNANGVEFIFMNPGTDTYAVQEAICKLKVIGRRTPEVIVSLHEFVGMAAAHGHFLVSGKPQVVFVHTTLGPQQIGGGLHNAQRRRIGVIVCSGRVPANLDGDKGQVRTVGVHWDQEQFDQAGPLRGYVKWDYEVRSAHSMHHVVQRAFRVAGSEPCGPVYISLPQDWLMEKIDGVKILPQERHAAVTTPQADSNLLEHAAGILAAANSPLIITDHSGRRPNSVASLVDLAETLGARVVSSQTWMNFPTTHPLYLCHEPGAHIENADAILVIDHDVPWVPSKTTLRSDAKIIFLDMDAIKENLPMWGFPVDIYLQGDSSKTLPVLNQMVGQHLSSDRKAVVRTRFEKIKQEHERMFAAYHKAAVEGADSTPISSEWLCRCLDETIDENTLVIEEAVTNRYAVLHQLRRTKPDTYWTGGTSLGFALGGALGAKLAAPDKTVVSLIGDGSFVFGCPTATLWAAAAYKAPFLTIIFNNGQYTVPKLALRWEMGQESYSDTCGPWIGTDITPSPDYAAIARGCHCFGQTVTEPAQIKSALKTALEQVRRGKPAVLDVRVAGL